MKFDIPLSLEIVFRSTKNRKSKVATYGKCYGLTISNNGILHVEYGLHKKFIDSFYFADVIGFAFKHDGLTKTPYYEKRVLDLFTAEDHTLDELM